MKLELKHLAPYLPYKVRYTHKYLDLNVGYGKLDTRNIIELINPSANHCILLRPLSDLTKVNGFSLSDMISHGYHNPFWLPENFEVKYLMHLDFEKLVSWHFDVFGLIEKGLAIDINTLD
jgi:hypothetical protein